MKPFTAALALETGRVTRDTRIQTAPGRITITGSPISDAHPHGVLTVAEVIQKSSNVGTVKMAMQMQPREMWELYASVGFGQKPQIDFPGAVTGRLRPYKTWRPIEQATMSYGYGLSASLFQLARAYTVFARDGELIPVTMLRRPEPRRVNRGQRVMSPRPRAPCARCCAWPPAPAAPRPRRRPSATRWAARPAPRASRKARATPNKYRAWFVGLAPVTSRASWWR
jgi:cell division protein FtsI (penicillin-binding protein 3)